MEKDEVMLYTDVKFQNDDMTVTLKNIDLEMVSKLSNKNEILTNILYSQWYLYGLYDVVDVYGYKFTMISKTKNKVELVKSN